MTNAGNAGKGVAMNNVQIENQADAVTGAPRYAVRIDDASGKLHEEVGSFETMEQARYVAGIVSNALQHIQAAGDSTLKYYLQKSGFEAPLSFEARHEPQQWWQRETQKESPDWPYWIVERDWSGYGVHHLGHLADATDAQALCTVLNRLVAQVEQPPQVTPSASP
jgi:hypothetical protein